MSEFLQKSRHKGIYLLPNLFTTINLLAGFYAIIAGMNGDFALAATAIFVAMVMDTLDGRVARLTHTQTEFGAQYDSLADIVAFGLAPALVAYSWVMVDLGKLGWSIAFLYVATAALRLARFNTQTATVDRRYFVGLPSPAAAGVLAGFIGLVHVLNIEGTSVAVVLALLTTMVSVLMVSYIRFYSFKQIDLRGRVPFIVMWVIVLGFVAISLDPPVMLFGAFFLYALSGPCAALWRWYNRKYHVKTQA
ncbi:MAG: CDP-diacylglycerol--serine O-phosphatidyltransferase [Gammaproteobacteria bacterium]